MESFTSKQILEILEISYKQLMYWEEKGLISPSISKAEGSGSLRLYSVVDVRQLKVIKELKDMGISLQKIRKCMETLRDVFPELKYPLLEKQLFTDGRTVYVLTENPDINLDVLMNRGQLVLFVPLKTWMEELKDIIRRFEEKEKEEDKEQEEFYRWAEGLVNGKGLKPMTPEEVAEVTCKRTGSRLETVYDKDCI